MNKKTTIANLKVKLSRLSNLEQTEKYELNTLNDYSQFLNSAIQRMNLTVGSSQNLIPGQASISSKPSNSERAKINELINKYSEALTEFSPKNDEPITNQFKKTSGVLKRTIFGINLALIAGSGIVFYNVGKDIGNNNENELNKSLNLKEQQINKLTDSLKLAKTKIIEYSNNIKKN